MRVGKWRSQLLAQIPPVSELGQKTKYSQGADDFRFGPESGLKTDIAGGPVRANLGSQGV